MTEKLAQIVAQLPTLSQHERAELAQLVLRSLESEEADVEAAWDQELIRRAERIHSGKAVAIPAEQVLAEWRRRIGS